MDELKNSIERIVARLNELPSLIAKAREETCHSQEIKEMENGLKDILNGLCIMAGTEVDDAGKSLYTNQASRETRARKLAKDDPDYKKLSEVIETMREKHGRATGLLETLNLEFQAQKAALYALTEMLKTENLKISAAPKVVSLEIHHDAQ